MAVIASSTAPVAAAGPLRAHYLEWGPVILGALGATAISVVLLTFGAALGLSILSPYPYAGISAKGVGDFFERLEDKKPSAEAGKSASELEVILRTHPPTAERIAMVRAQPTYPATPALSADDWRALRDACGGVSPKLANAAVHSFSSRRASAVVLK